MIASPLPFDEVFHRYAAFVWRVLVRHGIAQADLEDVSQEVFLVVHHALAGFERRSSVKTWLYGICRRVAANHRKRAAARHEVATGDVPEASASSQGEDAAFQAFVNKQSYALLELLLSRLPAEQAEVFALYELEELTMREVAESVGCSQNTAFSRLYAARRSLESEIKRLRAQRRVA